jgi:hypothetical protein
LAGEAHFQIFKFSNQNQQINKSINYVHPLNIDVAKLAGNHTFLMVCHTLHAGPV